MARQIIRLDEKRFNELVAGAVKKTLRHRLNEDWDDYGDDGLDDYTSELLGSMERKDKAANQAIGKSAEKKVDSNFVRTLFNTDMGSLFDYDFDDESDEEEADDVQSGNSNDGNVLYNKAMEALTTTNGSITFNEWFQEVSDETDENTAKQAFSAAKKEFDSYDVDDASDFSDRENVQTSDSTTQNQPGEQQHQAGNTLEYDGIQVTDDGNQFTMVAKEDNPQITIKGSSFKDVTDMYDRLWNNYARMEDVARNMGFTIYHGAYLWANDYDKFVRAAGGHEENLPILIDLDRVQSRGKKTNAAPHQQQSQGSQSGDASWMDKYLHSNGKYMMTPYQLNQLTPEQQAEWKRMMKKFPNKYKTYSQSSK